MGGGEGSKILEQIQGRLLPQQKLLKRGDWYRGERGKLDLLKNHDCPLHKVGKNEVVNPILNIQTMYRKIKVFQRQEDLRKEARETCKNHVIF